MTPWLIDMSVGEAVLTVIVYGMVAVVVIAGFLIVIPELWHAGRLWITEALKPEPPKPDVIDFDERRRRQLDRIVNPGRRLS